MLAEPFAKVRPLEKTSWLLQTVVGEHVVEKVNVRWLRQALFCGCAACLKTRISIISSDIASNSIGGFRLPHVKTLPGVKRRRDEVLVVDLGTGAMELPSGECFPEDLRKALAQKFPVLGCKPLIPFSTSAVSLSI